MKSYRDGKYFGMLCGHCVIIKNLKFKRNDKSLDYVM